MIAADIYINTAIEELFPESTLVLTKKLVDVDSSHGAYALYNKTYAVILHELGHAVGIGHIPVNGNVMSRDLGGGGIGQWAAPLAIELFNDPSPRENKFVDRHRDVFPLMAIRPGADMLDRVDFFTQNAKLGEQEKTALMCIYEYVAISN